MVTNLDIVYILDREYENLGLIDEYYSLIWTTRFRGAGEVQLELPATTENVSLLQPMRYLQLPSDPDTLMVIETLQITQSFEEGATLKVTGHSLESLLAQRTAERINVALDANPITVVKGLLNDNAVSSSNTKRNFPKMRIGKLLEDEVDKKKYLTYGVDGQNVYDLIEELTNHVDQGWRIKPDYTTKGMIVETYVGERRTYDQDKNPWVIFSPSYDNLVSSNFLQSQLTKYNVAMYKGPDAYYQDGRKLRDGVRGSVWKDSTEPEGFDRREIFIEDNQQWQDPESQSGDLRPQATMESLVKDSAKIGLEDAIEKDAFEGEVDTQRQFTYGVDFQIGDICQMSTEYGVDAIIRVEEVVQSKDNEGYKLTPTFIIMDFESKKE